MEFLIFLLIMLTLVAIPVYFQSHLARAPTRTERWLATAWLWFRRAVCFFAAALFTACSALLTYDVAIGEVRFAGLLGAIVLLAFAWMSAHWGIYGAGKSKTDLHGNEDIHDRRKKRYGWRW
jgi:hypothetical protein